jgi:hypothetical protein
MPRTRIVGGGGGPGTASRKSQIIEEEEDEVVVDESFEEYEEIEEVDDFSPIEAKSPAFEGAASSGGKAVIAVAREGTNADPALASAQSKGKAPEAQSRDPPPGSVGTSEEEYPPFGPIPGSDNEPELTRPPRSSSLMDVKPGTPRSNVTADSRTSNVTTTIAGGE